MGAAIKSFRSAMKDGDDKQDAKQLNEKAEGNVIEGTFSNLFIVDKGVLITPDLSGSGVDGVMRGLILDIAGSLAVPSRITKLQLDNVRRADEVFLCNALINIWPVRIYEDVHYDNFEITRFIMTELEKQLVT